MTAIAIVRGDITKAEVDAIVCGVFGYPIDEAAVIALRVARERDWDLDEIRFVLFSERDRAAFERAR